MTSMYLICLPFSGGGASFFRNWPVLAPADLTIVPVTLPGREDRFAEPLFREVGEAVDDLLPGLRRDLAQAERVGIFGHCLGAVLGFELARRLQESEGVVVDRLFASGAPAPREQLANLVSGLNDEAFLDEVTRFTGYSHAALTDPEMREFLLPMLRADCRMHEDYRPSTDVPLGVPVTILRGRGDELVSAAEMEKWANATTWQLSRREFDGGHMYMTKQTAGLIEFMAAELRAGNGRP
jgi:surfactin synthase thioesterase subunit